MAATRLATKILNQEGLYRIHESATAESHQKLSLLSNLFVPDITAMSLDRSYAPQIFRGMLRTDDRSGALLR